MGQLNDFCLELCKLLKKQHVRGMLGVLRDEDSAGWEKWLQFELIRFYNESGHDPYWECSYNMNLQHKPEKLINRLDFVYRKKNTCSNLYNGVELKVMRCPEGSINAILKDLSVVSKIRTCDWELRAVTGLSLYSTGIMKDKNENAKYKTFVDALVRSRRARVIECNGWSCLVLGWEAKSLSSPRSMKLEYRDYLTSISALAEKHRITFA